MESQKSQEEEKEEDKEENKKENKEKDKYKEEDQYEDENRVGFSGCRKKGCRHKGRGLAHLFGMTGVWLVFPATEGIAALLGLWWMTR